MTDKEPGSKTQITIAIIGLIGVLFGALFANWDKIFPADKTSPPVLSDSGTNTQSSPPSTSSVGIIGTYLMDKQSNRVIVVTHLSGNRYGIEEPSSPWPWKGEATLNGDQLNGVANFRNSLASMRVEGTVRRDRSIVVSYRFLKSSDGGDPKGRVDNHVWYPKN